MAQVNQRLWKIPGQRTKRKAWGFTAQINGKQVRRYKAEWTQDDAEAELAKALLQIEPEKRKGLGITLAQAADRYLAGKARKRTVEADRRQLDLLKTEFGGETPLAAVIVALNTSLRLGELLGLTWEGVDLSRGVIRLEVTKSGRRREVPLNAESYDGLVSLNPKKSGRIFSTQSIRKAYESAVTNA